MTHTYFIIGTIVGIILFLYFMKEFSRAPKRYNTLIAIGCVIAGLIGIIIGFLFKDRTTIKLSLIVMFGGGIFYGLQALAWKREEVKKA